MSKIAFDNEKYIKIYLKSKNKFPYILHVKNLL